MSWPQTPALLTTGPGLDQPRVRSSISGQFTLTSRWRLGRRHPPGGEEGRARTRSVTHRRLTPLYIPTTSTDQGRGSAQALREPLEIPRTPAAGRPSPPGTCWPLARRPRRPPRCETTAGTAQTRQGGPRPRPPPPYPGRPAGPTRRPRLLTRGSQCLAPQGGPAPPTGPRCRLGAKRESSNCQPSTGSIPPLRPDRLPPRCCGGRQARPLPSRRCRRSTDGGRRGGGEPPQGTELGAG